MTETRCRCCGRLIPAGETLCLACSDYDDMQTFTPRIVTNGDRLRAMTNEELAAFLDDLTYCCADQSCDDCPIGCPRDEKSRPSCMPENILDWVRRRAEE